MALASTRKRVFNYLKYTVALIFLLMLCSIAYYANEIRLARQQTPGLVAKAQQSYFKAVSIAKLSPEQWKLLLAIEDPAFYNHRGVDLSTPGAGMTTITQGLVKLLY